MPNRRSCTTTWASDGVSERLVKVAAAHLSPVFLDRDSTVDKACAAIAEAAGQGARLIVFPESFIPAFPLWSALQAPIYSHGFFRAMADQSIHVDGPELRRIAGVARRLGIAVSMGFSERSAASVGCLWNSNVLMDESGRLLSHHRKLMPTFYEKLTWAPGDGAGLEVVSTAFGRVGMLICGENTNPLARYALMAQGEQVHVSSYPPLWPTHDPDAAQRYDLAEAIRIRSAAHAFEAKCFNVVSAGFLDRAARERLGRISAQAKRVLDGSPRSVSLVVDPMGRLCAGPVSAAEEILYAQIDLDACVEPKQFHDVVGGYNRFDVFELRVDRRRQAPIRWQGERADAPPDPSPGDTREVAEPD